MRLPSALQLFAGPAVLLSAGCADTKAFRVESDPPGATARFQLTYGTEQLPQGVLEEQTAATPAEFRYSVPSDASRAAGLPLAVAIAPVRMLVPGTSSFQKRHQVRIHVEAPGYLPRDYVFDAFKLPPEEQLSVRLDRSGKTFTLATNPPGAAVYYAGPHGLTFAAETPVTLTDYFPPNGSLPVIVVKPGYQPARATLSMEGPTDISLALRSANAPARAPSGTLRIDGYAGAVHLDGALAATVSSNAPGDPADDCVLTLPAGEYLLDIRGPAPYVAPLRIEAGKELLVAPK